MTGYLLDLLSIQNQTVVAHFVAGILIIMVVVLTMVISNVLFLRFKRYMSRRNNYKLETYYRNQILKFVFENDLDVRLKLLHRLQKVLNSRERKGFFRRLLIAQIKVIEGHENDILATLYRQLGFYDADVEELESIFWWKRLAAIIRLENLPFLEMGKHFEALLDDRSEIVAIAAMRALARMKALNKATVILDVLSRRIPSRDDAFTEILVDMGPEHAMDIIKYLKSAKDDHVKIVCIKVLGELRSINAVDYLLTLAGSKNPEIAGEAVDALGKIGDSKAIKKLEGLLKHKSSFVRARSISALSKIGDFHLHKEIESLKADKNVEVRRAVFEALHA